MSKPALGRPPAAEPLDRETLIARFDGIRQFAQGGRRAPHKTLLLLYALGRLKHDCQTEIRFNAAEAVLGPLLRTYGPWGSRPRVSYPYGRLITDGMWRLPDRDELLDAAGEVRAVVARARDASAGFTPEVIGAFDREPELIDVVAIATSPPASTRRSCKPWGWSWAHPWRRVGVMPPLGPRCSRPTSPSAASAGSPCA